jgi:The Golgi pH Regulator (GPHR) Family N-terminal
MNSLSWLIYLAGVAEGLSTIVTVIAVLSGIAAIAAWIAFFAAFDETDSSGRPYSDEQIEQTRKVVRPTIRRVAFTLLFTSIFASVINVGLPSRQTILLVAASEMGERALMSRPVQEVIDPSVELLQTWIRQQTAAIREEATRRSGR